MIAEKAKQLFNDENFQASDGWLHKFMERWNFTIRQKTTVGQALPANLVSKVANFIKFCAQQRLDHSFQPNAIGNMDETAIWLDMPGSTTVDVIGAKSVPLKTTGHEKERVTVCLAAFADGRKLPPMMVFKEKKMPSELKNVNGVVIAMSPNGCMNLELTQFWIDKVWGSIAFTKRLLIWDTFRCHIANEVKQSLKKKRTFMAAIPGGCTKLLQPTDVSWNSPFKATYRTLYDDWLVNREHTFTPAGNMRAPTRDCVVTMVKAAWNAVTRESIIHSFEVCGITTHDVNLIHCTKTSGIASAAREYLLGWQPTQAQNNKEQQEGNEDDYDTGSEDDENSDDEIIAE